MEAMALGTGKGKQTFMHLLISKGHNDAMQRVVIYLDERLGREDLKRLLNRPNFAQKTAVDCGLQSRNMIGVKLLQKYGGVAWTAPPEDRSRWDSGWAAQASGGWQGRDGGWC